MSKDNSKIVNSYRQQLMYVSNQKQQIQMQVNILESTVKELENSKEKKVYKGIGNVFIYSDKADVLKNTKDTLESAKLKLKNLEKQESEIIKKLNDLNKNQNTNTKANDSKQDQTEGVA